MSNQSGAFQFRSALHGFHREDVVNYIDRMTREHETALSRLQTANSQLQAQLEQTNAAMAQLQENSVSSEDLDAANARIQSLTEENASLQVQLQELEQSRAKLLEAAQAAAAGSEEEKAPVQLERSEPTKEETPAAEGPSQDYKEQELAAYRRAEMAERLARERASGVYAEIRDVFGSAADRLDTGKNDLDLMEKALRSDIDQLMSLVANLRSTYGETVTSFAELNDRNRLPSQQEE